MKKTLIASLLLASGLISSAHAADYVIDTKGAHASINFKVSHLGYSWVTGRFNSFDGKFSYDADDIAATKISVNIDASSIDTNHAERNKHLRSDDFLDVGKFAQATFNSTNVAQASDGSLLVTGNLTMHGVSKAIVINAMKVGEGKDPWGGYRAGFTGTTSLAMKDFGLKMDFGKVLFELHIEGVRQ